MRLGKRSASLACLSMPSGKGYAFWTWPVLTLAFLDTEYFRKMRGNVKNRIKCDADFSIGQEWESICLTLGKGYFFGNVRPIFCRAWILWRYPAPYPGHGASNGSQRGRFHLVYPTLGEFFLWGGV